jgi:Tfp pilus assembly protein PilX
MNVQFLKKNRGVVLASALILLVSMTLIAVTVAYRSTMNELIAANQRDATNAMAIAESGLEAGFAEVTTNHADIASTLCDIADPDGDPATYDGVPLIDSTSISGGNYVVTVSDCVANTRAVLHSIGTVNGSERQLEVVLGMVDTSSPGSGTSSHSFLANDYIEIQSNYFVGPLIHIHTFGKVKVAGAPYTCVSAADCPNLETAPWGYITAAEYDPKTYELVTKNPYPWDLNGPDMDGLGTLDDNPYDIYAYYGIDPGATQAVKDAALDAIAKEVIPHVYPPTYREFATIELSADCIVSAGAASTDYAPGTVIHDVSTNGAWNGWTCNSQSAWSVNSEGTPYDAFYYVHGNIKAGGSGEKQTNGVWNATFVATGSFESGCCPSFGTWNQPTGNPTADNIFLLVGNDVLIQSSPAQAIEGIIAAHREVKLSGSQSHYKGAVIAENGLHHDYVNFPDSMQEVVDNAELGIDVQAEWERASINVINSNTILEGTGIGLGGGGSESGTPVLTAEAWRELVD